LPITDIELVAIAALAAIGRGTMPQPQRERAGSHGHADHVADEREEQGLADVAPRRAAERARLRDPAQVAADPRPGWPSRRSECIGPV